VKPYLYNLLPLAVTYGTGLLVGFSPPESLWLVAALVAWAYLTATLVASRETR
jgi:hypothetical protein